MMLDIHPAAIAESQKATRWYWRRSPKSATRFEAAVRDALEKIQKEPEAQRWLGHGARCRLLHKFPYLIVFRILEDRLQVVAISHNRRKSGYWRSRK